MSAVDIDAAIAAAWPDRWARANNPALPNRSKARNNLRKRWREFVAHQEFVAANPTAACRNCAHCGAIPHSANARNFCELDSDYYGYSVIDDLGSVCTRWEGGAA